MNKIMKFFENIPRGIVLSAGLCIILFLTIISAYLVMTPKKQMPASSAKSLGGADGGTVGGQGTPAYNQMVEALNDAKAQEAAKAGQSFVPTPIGDEQNISSPIETRRQPTPPPTRASLPTPPPPQRVESNKAFENDLKSIMARNKGGSSDFNILYVDSLVVAEERPSSPLPTIEVETARNHIKSGELLYGINELAINSDASSPVMVSIAHGPLKGVKAFGGFSRSNELMIVSFNRLVLENGETIQINGVGVDPSTSATDVASRVNTHFFSRWGGLLASSFLEGFGGAMQNRNQRVTDTGSTIVIDQGDKSYKDMTYEAFGKVGQRAANQFERGFDRPPTVYLDAGQAIGILIIDVR
ncbi:MAG: DotG/IcmE/VirB10 family protein [Candidatus Adiutrix sp.]